MMLSLIKKDFLIVKKYVLIMIVIALLVPVYVLWQVPMYAGKLGFIFSNTFSVLLLLQYVSIKESQYSRAAAFLCALPYPRKWFALSKYGFCLITYAGCCLIYWVETLLLTKLGSFNFKLCAALFFVLAVFWGIYFPLQYRFGFEKMKFVFIIIIMGFPFVITMLIRMKVKIDISFFYTVPSVVSYSFLVLAGIIILAVSASVSIRIYEKKDLL